MSKKLIKRILLSLLIAALAYIGHIYLDIKSDEESIEPFKEYADNLSNAAAKWMNTQLELSAKLSKDARLKRALKDTNRRRSNILIRRAIYEFGYLNEIKNVYIVRPNHSPPIIKSVGAPTLPTGVFTIMKQSNGGSKGLIMLNVGGKANILSVSELLDELGAPRGYVAFLRPLDKALHQFSAPFLSKLSEEYKFGLLRRQNKERIVGVTDFRDPKIQVLGNWQTDIPMFAGPAASGIYLHNSTEVVAAISPVSGHNNWISMAWAKTADVKTDVALWKTILDSVAGLIIFLLIITAIAKPKRLNRRHQTAKTGVIGKILSRTPMHKAHLTGKNVRTPSDIIKQASVPKGMHSKTLSQATDEAAETPSLPPKLQNLKGSNKQTANTTPAKLDQLKESSHPHQKKQKLRIAHSKYNETGELTDNIVLYIIRRCITEKNLKLLYQPVIDPQTKDTPMYEIFLRLLDEDNEIIPPNRFIPVAEEHGLMDELDQAVMEKVVSEHFSQKGNEPPAQLLINISGNSFDSIGYIHKLLNYVSDGRVKAGAIAFELKAKEIISDRKAMSFIRECRDLGIRFGIDYFGGGQQTIHAAKTLQFDYIKVDAMRFPNLAKDKTQQKEFATLALTAQKLGIPVVLERVETELVAKLATKLGYNYIQGYYYSPPTETFTTPIL